MSYVTGSHAVKVGLSTLSGKQTLAGQVTHPSYTFRDQRSRLAHALGFPELE